VHVAVIGYIGYGIGEVHARGSALTSPAKVEHFLTWGKLMLTGNNCPEVTNCSLFARGV
jgi:hypothetical protein